MLFCREKVSFGFRGSFLYQPGPACKRRYVKSIIQAGHGINWNICGL